MTDLRIAHVSRVVDLDGEPVHVKRGRTIAVGSHPIVADNPDLWRPLAVDFDVEDEDAASGDGTAVERPNLNARRAWWETYARYLGVAEDAIAAANKDELVALCDNAEG